MNSNEIQKRADNRRAPAAPAPNVANLPHGSTQDQLNEMESEGQATKQGQKPSEATSLGPREFEEVAMKVTTRQTDNDAKKGAQALGAAVNKSQVHS